jgi:hypothetical protein
VIKCMKTGRQVKRLGLKINEKRKECARREERR